LSLDFNSNQLSLVKCGWNVVLCHVRGGGERGKIWYEAGKLLKKTNSFNDLECIIEHVKNSGLGNPDLFAGYGVSAGGMIFGNLINRRPGLLRALILKSPFLDVLDTMLDPSEALTQHEYGEWGNPSTSKEIYSLIKSYDPYQNLKQENVFMFPSILFRASLNDDHVPFWNSAKYIAKIRSLQSYNRSSGNVCSPSNCRPIIFAIDEIFGHSGDSSRSGSAEEAAEDYAFLHWALKIK
jgi:oligopeptidase B